MLPGLEQESIASLGPMCCALTPVCNPPRGGWGYTGCGFGFVIGIGIFRWSRSPSAPCYCCGSFNLLFFGTLAAVEGKGPGAANYGKINMLVVRRSWRFPYFQILQTIRCGFSISSLGCRLPKER